MILKNNKTALNLAITFFKGNYLLSFLTIGVMIILNILGYLPIIGIFFIFAYTVLNLSIQIYFGQIVNSIQNIDEIKQIVSEIKLLDFLTKFLAQAIGGFLGLIFIALILFILFFILIIIFGGANIESFQFMQQFNQQEMTFAMVKIYFIPSLIILLIAGFLLYIFPAVMGEIILSKDFNDAFKKALLLLKPSFWKKCFNKNYFLLIIVWSFIFFGLYILSLIFSLTIILLPVALVILYILALYNSAIYLFAKKLMEV